MNKPCEEMDFNEFVDWACGYLLLAIGRGEWRSAVHMVISQAAMNKVFGGGKPKTKQ